MSVSIPRQTDLGLAVRYCYVVPLPYTHGTAREGLWWAVFGDHPRIAKPHAQLTVAVQRYCEARLVTLGRQCEEVAR